MVGELMVNINELGFELTGNSAQPTISFETPPHPACPSNPPACPISTISLSSPLGVPAFHPAIVSLTGSSIIAGGLDTLASGLGTAVPMPGPKTYIWTYGPSSGGDTTSSGSVSHFFENFQGPNPLPSAYGPGVTVKVTDGWGRYIYGWWTDEDIFDENEV
ncbi:MAG: hypothetical protein ACI9C1_000763 [Candidatus Aldehydirespiratoraceae bacterium]